jgi:multidrug efflux pump subunit AcrB
LPPSGGEFSATQQLGREVEAAFEHQSSRLDNVQQVVGAQTKHTYDQLMVLYQQQQLQSQQQLEVNNRLMKELESQRSLQQALVDQLMAQKATADAHSHGLQMAAEASVSHSQQLEEMRRRTSARWHAFTSAPVTSVPVVAPSAGVQVVYGFQEVPKAPTFSGNTKVQMRKFMDQYEAYTR